MHYSLEQEIQILRGMVSRVSQNIQTQIASGDFSNHRVVSLFYSVLQLFRIERATVSLASLGRLTVQRWIQGVRANLLTALQNVHRSHRRQMVAFFSGLNNRHLTGWHTLYRSLSRMSDDATALPQYHDRMVVLIENHFKACAGPWNIPNLPAIDVNWAESMRTICAGVPNDQLSLQDRAVIELVHEYATRLVDQESSNKLRYASLVKMRIFHQHFHVLASRINRHMNRDQNRTEDNIAAQQQWQALLHFVGNVRTDFFDILNNRYQGITPEDHRMGHAILRFFERYLLNQSQANGPEAQYPNQLRTIVAILDAKHRLHQANQPVAVWGQNPHMLQADERLALESQVVDHLAQLNVQSLEGIQAILVAHRPSEESANRISDSARMLAETANMLGFLVRGILLRPNRVSQALNAEDESRLHDIVRLITIPIAIRAMTRAPVRGDVGLRFLQLASRGGVFVRENQQRVLRAIVPDVAIRIAQYLREDNAPRPYGRLFNPNAQVAAHDAMQQGVEVVEDPNAVDNEGATFFWHYGEQHRNPGRYHQRVLAYLGGIVDWGARLIQLGQQMLPEPARLPADDPLHPVNICPSTREYFTFFLLTSVIYGFMGILTLFWFIPLTLLIFGVAAQIHH